MFVWSSQLSTSPTRKKGREILESLETGKAIELWMRRKGNDIAFTYLGRVVPIRYEGSEPMLVTFRLLTPLSGELQSRLGVKGTRPLPSQSSSKMPIRKRSRWVCRSRPIPTSSAP